MKPIDVEILLVEDNPVDVEMAMYALEQNNVSGLIQVARDGAEALDFLFGRGSPADRGAKNALKLILLDLKLPRIDGLEVLRRIKADARTRRVPVVVLTTSSEERDIRAAYDLGANSYLVKSMNFDQFTEAVRDLGVYWLRHNRPPGT